MGAFTGSVPTDLPGATWRGPVHQVAQGGVLLDLPGLGRALVRDGTVAGVELADGAADEDVRWLLDGPVAQAARLLQGRFALRAAGVVVGGRAVALTGAGASGKSSLAAALARRGHAVLADHELTVSLKGDGVASALPSTPWLDLWPDVFEDVLGLSGADGAVVRPALAKRRFAFPAASESPLALVVVLDPRGDAPDLRIEELRGTDSVAQILDHSVLSVLIEPLGLRAEHFAWGAGLAAATRVVRLGIDRTRRDPVANAEAVEALLA